MSITVVERSLVPVTENTIGFGGLFEGLFRSGVIRIFVRMVLDGEPPVGFFDLLRSRGTVNAKNFVVIALRRTIQN